ncbi:MAG: hypothetical protein IJ153_02845 [Clostridia bacterium]|nr:hypothetical protein [Clostridia bacterium]
MDEAMSREMVEYFRTCFQQGLNEIDMRLPPLMMKQMTVENGLPLIRLLARAGYEPFARINVEEGYLKIHQLFPCAEPVFYSQTREELIQTLRNMEKNTGETFRIVLSQPLMDAISENNWQGIRLAEGTAGVIRSEYTLYPEQGMIRYTAISFYQSVSGEKLFVSCPKEQPSYQRSAATQQTAKYQPSRKEQKKPVDFSKAQSTNAKLPVLDSLQSIIQYVEQSTAKLPEMIEFICHPQLIKQLQEGILNNAGKRIPRSVDLTQHAGVRMFHMHTNPIQGHVSLRYLNYYPGFRILQLVRMKQESRLSVREKLTLQAARDLLQGIPTHHQGNMALAISEAIGRRTVYTIDETTDEDDCAIGPLLNGEANCDGYADAFYLCAGLAGLKVRYQYGCSNLPGQEKGDLASSNHLWNLVQIDGRWTALDATWDQNAKGNPLEYSHCMVGLDRADYYYRWNRDMSPELAIITDVHRADNIHEYRCGSKKELQHVFRQARKDKLSVFYVYLTDPSLIDSPQKLAQYIVRAGFRDAGRYVRIPEFNCWKVMMQK